MIKVWDRRTMDASACVAGAPPRTLPPSCAHPHSARRRSPPVGVLAGHSDGLTCVSSRGDGNYLVSNAKDQCAKLWDLRCMRNPEQQRQLPRVPSRFHWDYRWMDYPVRARAREQQGRGGRACPALLFVTPGVRPRPHFPRAGTKPTSTRTTAAS